MTEAEARALLDAIQVNLDDVARLAEELHAGQGWVALGYPTWEALVSAEIRPYMPKLERARRRELVDQLTQSQMSTRAIAAVVGTSVGTVQADRCSELNTSGGPTTGLDGKTYTRKAATLGDLKAALDADTKAIIRAHNRWADAIAGFKALGVPLNYDRLSNQLERAIDTWRQTRKENQP